MSAYPNSRIILRIVQVLGWIVASIVVALGAAHLMGKDPFGVGLILYAIFGAALNHALMAIGMAIFDLVDTQRELLDAAMQQIKLMRDQHGDRHA
jgi:hypothetical protein